MKVLADLVSDEGSLPGLQTAAFLLCAHMAFSPCMLVDTERERERENLLFIRAPIMGCSGGGGIPYDLIASQWPLLQLPSDYGLGLQHTSFRGRGGDTNIQPIIQPLIYHQSGKYCSWRN